jgi:5-deoxy-glucuronate isomerase
MGGTIEVSWDGQKTRVSRSSLFDEAPWCLSLAAGSTAIDGDAEISVHATENPRMFPTRRYTPDECTSEDRAHYHR